MTVIRWDTSLVRPPRGTLDDSDLGSDVDSVDFVGDDYREMFARWELVEDLCGGRDAMIRKHVRWLPREPKEKDTHYTVRLSRSFLYSVFADTIEGLARKPFERDLLVNGELPERLAEMVDDVDLEGTTLHDFGHRLLRDGIKYGHALVFVDFSGDVRGVSLADERASGARPFFRRIKAPDLLDWKWRRVEGLGKQLTEIRFRDWSTVRSGKYGSRRVELIRVYRAPLLFPGEALPPPGLREEVDFEIEAAASEGRDPVLDVGTFEVWQRVASTVGSSRSSEADFELSAEGVQTHSFPGIPLAWFYTLEDGFLRSRPPLFELAEMNLSHYQAYSDGRNLLRFVSVAILFGKLLSRGASATGDPSVPSQVVVSANRLVETDSKDGDLRYVEHTGKGHEAIEKEILRTEERMEALGRRPLVPRNGRALATTEMRDDSESASALKTWVRALENCLFWAFEIAGTYVGEVMPDDSSIEVFDDIDLPVRKNEDLAELSNARKRGDVDRVTYLEKLKKFGILDDEDEVEEIMERLLEESTTSLAARARMLEAVRGAPADDEPTGQDVSASGADDDDQSDEDNGNPPPRPPSTVPARVAAGA